MKNQFKMRDYIEMTKIFEPYKPKQTVQIKGVMSNVSREQYDKLCKERRHKNEQ